MTPEERDRLVRVEGRVESLDDWLRSIDIKLEELRTAASMGKGAWILMLKLGGVISAVLVAAAWIYDHLPWRHP